jgi:iron(II)-dependent oxidoreductase
VRKTTSVDTYPQGASPFGVLDMAGNVWEWTRSLVGDDASKPSYRYPYKLNDGRENLQAAREVFRSVRGGAFDGALMNVWDAYRIRGRPSGRLRILGFRVVVRPSS